jgi:DNA-binding NarL/FixJ family response regulator
VDEALSIVHSGVAVHVVVINLNTAQFQDSIHLGAAIRAEYPSVKVVVASGQSPRAELCENVDAFFQVPYDIANLIAVIRSLLDK